MLLESNAFDSIAFFSQCNAISCGENAKSLSKACYEYFYQFKSNIKCDT